MSKIDTELISNRSRVSVGSIKQVVYEHRYFRGLLSESLLPGQLGILHALTVVLDGCAYTDSMSEQSLWAYDYVRDGSPTP